MCLYACVHARVSMCMSVCLPLCVDIDLFCTFFYRFYALGLQKWDFVASYIPCMHTKLSCTGIGPILDKILESWTKSVNTLPLSWWMIWFRHKVQFNSKVILPLLRQPSQSEWIVLPIFLFFTWFRCGFTCATGKWKNLTKQRYMTAMLHGIELYFDHFYWLNTWFIIHERGRERERELCFTFQILCTILRTFWNMYAEKVSNLSNLRQGWKD